MRHSSFCELPSDFQNSNKNESIYFVFRIYLCIFAVARYTVNITRYIINIIRYGKV